MTVDLFSTGALAGLATIVLALLAGIWRAFSAGKKSAEAKQIQEDLIARDIANDVQNDVGAMTPAQRREELRKWGNK